MYINIIFKKNMTNENCNRDDCFLNRTKIKICNRMAINKSFLRQLRYKKNNIPLFKILNSHVILVALVERVFLIIPINLIFKDIILHFFASTYFFSFH